MDSFTPDNIVFFILLLISITMHEFGHAFAADKLGDPLPRAMGRVTLNPLAHADLLGTIILPALMIFGGSGLLFGWGKPVYVSLPNPKTRMRDDLISTLAGPFVNLLLALIFALILAFGANYNSEYTMKVAQMGLVLNCVLFIFNMLPIPPLDGSHFFKYAFNISNETYAKLQGYGFFIVLALVFFVPQFRALLQWLISIMVSGFILIADIVFRLIN